MIINSEDCGLKNAFVNFADNFAGGKYFNDKHTSNVLLVGIYTKFLLEYNQIVIIGH